jgi:hypothetical protein
MSLHATFKQIDDVPIVRVLSEAESTAIMHKFFEFVWLVLTKLLNCNFFLFLLDIGIFFLL